MAIFDAILENADIRFAAFTVAGDDQVAICDKPETGQLVASIPIVSVNGINCFLHLELPLDFIFAFRQGPKGSAGVCLPTLFCRQRKVNGTRKIIAFVLHGAEKKAARACTTRAALSVLSYSIFRR